MSRFFLSIAYDGTAYSGWQRQPNAITVQQVIEDACSLILRNPYSIVGAGRTDAGVHARGMVAHIDLPMSIEEAEAFVVRLEKLLPRDISVYGIRKVHDNAHARFDATHRTYHYYVTECKNPFRRTHMMKIYHPLDYDRMNEAAICLLNYTDFTSFSKLHTDVKTNNCRITEAFWKKGQAVGEWIFTITADRFLRNMVRAIVGTLFEVGRGRMSVVEFCRVIEAKDRGRAASSADALGLFLDDVGYPY